MAPSGELFTGQCLSAIVDRSHDRNLIAKRAAGVKIPEVKSPTSSSTRSKDPVPQRGGEGMVRMEGLVRVVSFGGVVTVCVRGVGGYLLGC